MLSLIVRELSFTKGKSVSNLIFKAKSKIWGTQTCTQHREEIEERGFRKHICDETRGFLKVKEKKGRTVTSIAGGSVDSSLLSPINLKDGQP